MAVTQLTTGGDVDKTFGAGGTGDRRFRRRGRHDVPPRSSRTARSSSRAPRPPTHAFAVARLGATGMLDPGFGAAGTLTLTFGSSAQEASAVALQPDGKLVVAGTTLTGDVYQAGGRAAAAERRAARSPAAAARRPRRPRRAAPAGARRSSAPPAATSLRGTRRADVIVALGGRDTVLARGGQRPSSAAAPATTG